MKLATLLAEARKPAAYVLSLERLARPDDILVDGESEAVDALLAAAGDRAPEDFDFGYDAENKRLVAIPKGQGEMTEFFALPLKGPRSGLVPRDRGDVEWDERVLGAGAVIKFK